MAKPLTYVKRIKEGPKGQPIGTYATSTEEVYAIVREAWGGIFEGNCQDPHRQAAMFMQKYQDYTYKEDEQPHKPLTADDMKQACEKAGKSAAGDARVRLGPGD